MKCPHCGTEQWVLFVIKEHKKFGVLDVECNKCEKRFTFQVVPVVKYIKTIEHKLIINGREVKTA